MKYLVPIGRILFALIFLRSGFGHFSQQTIGYAQMHHVPLASVLVPVSGIIAIAGAISIMLGWKARMGAWLIVAFLVPVTLMMHDFWNLTDPMERMLQTVMFMKNLSMLGGALLVAYFGAGPVSVDERLKGRNNDGG